MAVAVVSAVMSSDGERGLHPFFTRPLAVTKNERNDETPESGQTQHTIHARETPCENSSKGIKRKNADSVASTKKQETLTAVVVPHEIGVEKRDDGREASLVLSSQGLLESRHKRRCTNENERIETKPQEEVISRNSTINPTTNSDFKPNAGETSSKDSVQHNGFKVTEQSPMLSKDPSFIPATPPKKMLRLKINGRFSSPDILDSRDEVQSTTLPSKGRKRGRPPKSARRPAQLLVKIAYGTQPGERDDLKARIDRILNNEERIQCESTKIEKAIKPDESKATHPFFLPKPKTEPSVPARLSPRKASAVTPGKLRAQTSFHSAQMHDTHGADSFGSNLLKDRLMFKHPGSTDPPFPRKGQVHVRNVDEPARQPVNQELFHSIFGRRKRKEARLPFPERESVVAHKISGSVTLASPQYREDGFCDPHPLLHVPERLLICGTEIFNRVSTQLHEPVAHNEGASSQTTSRRSKAYFAAHKLQRCLPTTMTAFDLSKGETQTWVQKYAPSSAAEVLQPSIETSVLKDWLNSLVIHTISSGITREAKAIPKNAAKPRKKRKKRVDDLDDFLVDDDEDEPHDMNELLDPDTESSALTSGKQLKSVVLSSHRSARQSNAVLISGPHGCGKTAAVYAVAKELGFRVFEINPGERRNGRDVIDRVGDMAENHVVKHHDAELTDVSSTDEPRHIEEAFQRDLESGRQGKMNAFFKPQVASKPATVKRPQQVQVMKTIQEAVRKPSGTPQQSLILLEEVDILFKEDKDFWTTVLKMIADSKRPFIMTCNDEDLVPIQAISLHAILRFSYPAEDVAADYMLTIAASEGHLLDRNAVTALYRSRNQDLRACITQLDFWCQMGIGDPREGLGWIYQRWPPGADTDPEGRKLRVVSDGTYTESLDLAPDIEELGLDDILHWNWTQYDVDPAIILGWNELDSIFNRNPQPDPSSTPIQNLSALKRYENLAESLSIADFCCAQGLPESAPLDTTTPSLSDKARSHYTENLPLLQTDEHIDHSHFSESLSISMTISAFITSGCYTHSGTPSSFSTSKQSFPYITSEKPKSINPQPLSRRRAFACLDAIAVPDDSGPFAALGSSAIATSSTLLQSGLDGPFRTVAVDIAPFVRSIVRYERMQEEQQQQRESIAEQTMFSSEDDIRNRPRHTKRARTTRAARSALEGSQRAVTGSRRRERWFSKELDYDTVLATGGAGIEWQRGGGGGGGGGGNGGGESAMDLDNGGKGELDSDVDALQTLD